MYCLPVLKHERHRQALLRAVASGSPKFFLGTDSAPHAKTAKENACGACVFVYLLVVAWVAGLPSNTHTFTFTPVLIVYTYISTHAHTRTHAGCAGCFSAFAGLELYAEVFESLGALDKFEAFTSRNGARFYGLPENGEKITLERRPWRVPDAFPLGGGAEVVPLKAGQEMAWALKE